MLSHFVTLAWRQFQRHVMVSTIKVVGLAIGVACCLLIYLYLQHEWSYDRFHERADRIYRVLGVGTANSGAKFRASFSPLPLGPALRADYPEISDMVRLITSTSVVGLGDKRFTERVLFADEGFFTLFSFPLRSGDAATVLSQPNAAVISVSLAAKYFGAEDPLGKRLTLTLDSEPKEFIVTGVAENVPTNSSIPFELVLPFRNHPEYDNLITNWGSNNAYTFIGIGEGQSSQSLERKLDAFVARHFDKGAGRPLLLQPITAIHLDPNIRGGLVPASSPTYGYLLTGIALLILIISCVNFSSLAIGRSFDRMNEVGLRKVFGATRINLIVQLWGEVLVLLVLATLVALVLTDLSLPVFNQFAGKLLSLSGLFHWSVAPFSVGLFLIVGLATGYYPALKLSYPQPISILKGRFGSGKRPPVIRGLIVVQLLITSALIFCVLTMFRQLSYLRAIDLGYHPEAVVIIPTQQAGAAGRQLVERFRNAVSQRADVLGVTTVNNVFTRGQSTNTLKEGAVQTDVFVYRVGYDFVRTMGMSLIAGRDFSFTFQGDQEGAVIVNEALVQTLGWADPIGRRLSVDGDLTVVGVVKDFHYRSLHSPIEPALLRLSADYSSDNLLVRIKSNTLSGTLTAFGTVWKTIAPETPFGPAFLDEEVAAQYDVEVRWNAIVGYATALAIGLAGLGLFGLATLIMSRRTKEIGVRKVLGASDFQIVFLCVREFLAMGVIGFLLAVPVAWLTMRRWLEDFAFRTDLDPFSLLLTFLILLTVVLVSVGAYAFRTAGVQPATTLRQE